MYSPQTHPPKGATGTKLGTKFNNYFICLRQRKGIPKGHGGTTHICSPKHISYINKGNLGSLQRLRMASESPCKKRVSARARGHSKDHGVRLLRAAELRAVLPRVPEPRSQLHKRSTKLRSNKSEFIQKAG
jgi:hypothetical protein